MLGGSLRPRPRTASPDSRMTAHSRVPSKDEELGKRDDDFKPVKRSTTQSLLQPWHWRKRRIIMVLTGMLFLYLFVQNIPTDLGPANNRLTPQFRPQVARPSMQLPPVRPRPHDPNHDTKHGTPHGAKEDPVPSDAPPRPRGARDDYYYNGKIRFLHLASTLRGIARTMGSRPKNRNVLFAASSLKSAANLIPMACDMARWDRNYVHLAVFGREDLSMDDIMAVNGVDPDKCDVYFHDARPEFGGYSTDARAEASVMAAMKYIQDYMHPQVLIMDDSLVEDAFFTRGLREKASDIAKTLIEIPAGRYEDFLWIGRLDSGSLSSWFKPTIDILVQSSLGTSGNLYKLVKSLQNADYDGLRVPKLTIDLPTDVTAPVKRFLEGVRWPPSPDPSPLKTKTLTLHHRISSTHMSSEQSSLRFLESFYPVNNKDNHVLILSPQAELSPMYLQYLHYNILEYKYSSWGAPGADDLFGISLDVPSIVINGSDGFTPPLISNMNGETYSNPESYDQSSTAPFLYQAPSSTANLIFAEKWTTLHNFLANRLTVSHTGKAKKPQKLVSEAQPAWLEYLLELMRARGWSILHPSSSLVTIHNEGAQIPEEFNRKQPAKVDDTSDTKEPPLPDEEGFLTADETPKLTKHVEHETPHYQALHMMLPFDGDLPELSYLPHLSHTGELIEGDGANNIAEKYVVDFRRDIGLCSAKDAGRSRAVYELKTDDLFCLPGVEPKFTNDEQADDEDEEGETMTAEQAAQSIAAKVAERMGDSEDDDFHGATRAGN